MSNTGGQISEKYYLRLQAWKKRSGKDNQKIADGTVYFRFSADDSPFLNDATVARVLESPPLNKRKTYSLLRVIAVFYIFEVATRQEIEEFLDQSDIELPDRLKREDVWKVIEAGKNEYLKQYVTEKKVQGVVSTPDNQPDDATVPARIPHPSPGRIKNTALNRVSVVLLFVGVGGGITIAIIISILLLSSSSTPSPAPTIPVTLACEDAVQETPPEFIPDQGFSQFTANPTALETSLLSNHVRSIALNEQGVWIGYKGNPTAIDGVSLYRNNQWIHCLGLGLVQPQTVNSFLFDEEKVFIGVDGSDIPGSLGVAVLDNAQWKFYREDTGLPDNIVFRLSTDDEGAIWAATHEGVAKLIGDRWETIYTVKSGELPDADVYQMFDDSQHNRWFAMVDAGISRLKADNSWQHYYTSEVGLQNVRAIVEDSEGNIWFATSGGLVRFSDEQWTVFHTDTGFISNAVADVAVDKFGRIWAATDVGVVYSADSGQTWQTHSTLPALDIEFGCDGCAYDDNHLWLGLDGQGIGHVRIPPVVEEVRFTSIPERVQLQPGEMYTFEVEVEVLEGSLKKSDGDSLRNVNPKGTDLHGAFPTIELIGTPEVQKGQRYTFTNKADPICITEPGIYQMEWAVWKGRRVSSEVITVEIEVVDSSKANIENPCSLR